MTLIPYPVSIQHREFPYESSPFAEFSVPEGEGFGGGGVEVVAEAHHSVRDVIHVFHVGYD